MRINRPLFYNQHYYFDKQELGEDIKPILNSKKDDIEIKNKKDELFDLYRAGQLERLCGIQPTEIEWMPALDAIGRCFELTTEVSINLTNYCSVNGVYIGCPHNPDIQIEPTVINQPNSINTFKVNPFCLDLDAIHNENVIFDISYTIHGTVSQNLIPSLEFYSKEKLKQQYFSSEELIVDLSQIGQRTISFEIPAMDIFTQNEGYYILKLGTFDFAKIEFPRCGLPINEGIYSLAELRDFCNRLTGSPSDELFSFYELLKRGDIVLWLQDDKEEEEYKRKISKHIEETLKKHQFKINDINSVLKIISNRTITFPMSDYFSVEISKIASRDIIGKQNVNDKKYYFILWGSTTSGKLTTIIQPKNECIGVDIDFIFKFRTESMSLMDNVFHFNLKDIGQRIEVELDFRIYVPQSQNMDEFDVYLIDNQGFKQETKTRIIVTGEKIPIPLPNDSAITMVGIYSLKQEPFYIAQTPLTQMQVQGLIEIANENLRPANLLSGALINARNRDGENGALPVSLIGRGAIADILENLNISFGGKFVFGAPTVEDLTNALYNGMEKHRIAMLYNQNHQLHPVSLQHPIHSTMLGIYDLLGNVLSYTKSHERGTSHFLAFGTTYRETQQERLIRKIDSNNVADVGFRPKMVKNHFKTGSNAISTEPSELRKHDNSDSGSSYKYYGDFIQPIDFAVYL